VILLDVKNLDVSFTLNRQRLHAVRGVSFCLKEGEALGIVGESGCGKSTLAKALLRLGPRTSHLSGSVFFRGIELLSLCEKEMQRVRGKEIGMIFQDPMTALNPTMKIGRQVIEGRLFASGSLSRRKKREVALEMLHLVGIPSPEDVVDAYPHTLSGGQRQRALIALSLAARPNILIADEPTTALDVTLQVQILQLLKTLQRKLKTSVLLITHDLNVIAHFCQNVLVMYAGKIVESAPVAELFATPLHPYTQGLLESIPRLNTDPATPLAPIPGSPPRLTSTSKGCSFAPRCSKAMKICKEREPLLEQAASSHYFACHLHLLYKDKQHVKQTSHLCPSSL